MRSVYPCVLLVLTLLGCDSGGDGSGRLSLKDKGPTEAVATIADVICTKSVKCEDTSRTKEECIERFERRLDLSMCEVPSEKRASIETCLRKIDQAACEVLESKLNDPECQELASWYEACAGEADHGDASMPGAPDASCKAPTQELTCANCEGEGTLFDLDGTSCDPNRCSYCQPSGTCAATCVTCDEGPRWKVECAE